MIQTSPRVVDGEQRQDSQRGERVDGEQQAATADAVDEQAGERACELRRDDARKTRPAASEPVRSFAHSPSASHSAVSPSRQSDCPVRKMRASR